MKIQAVLVSACFLTLVSSCTQPTKIDNMMVPSKPDGSGYTKEEVQAAIIGGCSARGWSAQVIEEGMIHASIIVRGVKAEAAIPYGNRTFSIIYRNSEGRSNRRYYNRWAANLHRSIVKEFGVNARGF